MRKLDQSQGPLTDFSLLARRVQQGGATSLTMLWISVIPSALFAHNFTITKAVVSDLSTDEERAATLGKLGLAAGLGFMCGPVAQLFISDYRGATLFATFLQVLSLGAIYLLPGGGKGPASPAKAPAAGGGEGGGLWALIKALFWSFWKAIVEVGELAVAAPPSAKAILFLRFALSMGFHVFYTVRVSSFFLVAPSGPPPKRLRGVVSLASPFLDQTWRGSRSIDGYWRDDILAQDACVPLPLGRPWHEPLSRLRGPLSRLHGPLSRLHAADFIPNPGLGPKTLNPSNPVQVMQVLLKERFSFGPNDYSNYFAFIGLVYGVSQIVSKHAVNSTRDDPTRMVMACTLVMGLVNPKPSNLGTPTPNLTHAVPSTVNMARTGARSITVSARKKNPNPKS